MRVWTRLLLLTFIACALPADLGAQGDSILYVVSYIEAAPASQGQVATMLKQLADASRKEGAVRFEILQGSKQPNQFVMLEIWRDQQALDAHRKAPHTTQFQNQVTPLLTAPLDERLCVATTVAPLAQGRGAVYVVTHVDVGPGDRETAARLIRTFAEESRGDAGNQRFDVVHQAARTNHLTVIEIWTDEKSDDGHQLAGHTKKFRAEISPFLGALYDQRWYRPL